MTPLKTITLAVTGLSFLSYSAYAQSYSKSQIGMAMMRGNTVSLDHKPGKTLGHHSVWAHLRSDFRMTEVNPELVRRYESKLVSSAAYFNRTIERSRPYIYHISREVSKRNMPAEIALLPFIESEFKTTINSRVGASGLWQFMPATGRHYGLEQTPLYDGRHDVYAATDAALDYLEYLHGLFGDWSLALAAYNWGEGNVGRAVNRARAQGLEPVYENLKMPTETRNYVPKLLAVRNIINNPQYFGINFSDIDNKPFFKTVSLDRPIDLDKAASLAGISRAEFDLLNPAFKQPVFIPKNGRKLLLPVAAAGTFERNYKETDRNNLLSWDVYIPSTATSLDAIAMETGTNVADLKRWNGIGKSNTVAAGRNILVSKSNSSAKPANFAGLDIDTNPNDNKLQAVPDMMAAAANAPLITQNQSLPRPEPAKPPVSAAEPQIAVVREPVPPVVGIDSATPAAPQTENTASATLPLQPDDLVIKTEPATAAATPQPAIPSVETSAVQAAAPIENYQSLESLRASVEAERNRVKQLAEARAKQQQQAAEVRALAAAKAESPPSTHKVDSGDTLYNIAKRYNMNVADLVAANNIKGNTIRQGQVLKVAGIKGKAAQTNIRPASYTVRKGDTLADIARRFNVDVKDVRRWNKNSSTIKPGQSIKLQGS